MYTTRSSCFLNRLGLGRRYMLYIMITMAVHKRVITHRACLLSLVSAGLYDVSFLCRFRAGKYVAMTSWQSNAFHITRLLCGKSCGFPSQTCEVQVMWSSNVCFVPNLNNMLNKQSSCLWFETPRHSTTWPATMLRNEKFYLMFPKINSARKG